MTNHASLGGWFTLLHCGCFLADPDALSQELIESNQVQLIFTRGQLWPSGIVVACVCLCVCVCVCPSIISLSGR